MKNREKIVWWVNYRDLADYGHEKAVLYWRFGASGSDVDWVSCYEMRPRYRQITVDSMD